MAIAQEVELAQELIRANSPSGAESPATALLVESFRQLGFDEAYLDGAGNAVGIIRRGEGPTVMLNGHLDVVPAGDPAIWPHPPFSGVVADGKLWGRGACDMKGPVAAMTLAAADVALRDISGTVIVSGVVQEEVGGLGARYLTENLASDVIILGEPSNLELKLGHRGRVEAEVHLPGRIAHAAKSSLGENALYRAARYLSALEALDLPAGGPLGASTATPTNLQVFPGAPNVVPGSAQLTIDYRNVVEDDPQSILERLRSLDPEARVEVGEEHAVSEDGQVSETFPRINSAYLAPPESPWVEAARSSIEESLRRCDRQFREGVWWFATDAPYLAARGATIIGFGPGEPELAHTTNESISIEQMAIARSVYANLVTAYLGGK